MRVYLDNCCLQRPFDNQLHPRIRVETEAVFAILAAVQAREISLLSSEALIYEIQRIPDPDRRIEALSILTLAAEKLFITEEAESLALSFEQMGLHALDALHLALASIAKADFFCTCDDRLLNKAISIANLDCRPISLLNLLLETTK